MTPLLKRAPLLAAKGLLAANVSVMHIFYRSNVFHSQKKEELIGTTVSIYWFNWLINCWKLKLMHEYFLKFQRNFFVSRNIHHNWFCKIKVIGFFMTNSADIGGLLGLFMGFSVFSIIEIFYSLTIRPCNYIGLTQDACWGNLNRGPKEKLHHKLKHELNKFMPFTHILIETISK